MPARALAGLVERHARRHGDVLERAVVPVLVEAVGLRVVGDEHVEPAVAVVVEQRDAEPLRPPRRSSRPLLSRPRSGRCRALWKSVGLCPLNASGVQYDLPCRPASRTGRARSTSRRNARRTGRAARRGRSRTTPRSSRSRRPPSPDCPVTSSELHRAEIAIEMIAVERGDVEVGSCRRCRSRRRRRPCRRRRHSVPRRR